LATDLSGFSKGSLVFLGLGGFSVGQLVLVFLFGLDWVFPGFGFQLFFGFSLGSTGF